jgi:hypothetical protein
VPRPLPVDRAAYLRLRWRARAGTAIAALPAALLLLNTVLAARAEDPRAHATGAWSFFYLGVYLLVAGAGVARLWLRSRAARPVVQRLDDLGAARPSDLARGVPGVDAPSGAHRGLTGRTPPPRRW